LGLIMVNNDVALKLATLEYELKLSSLCTLCRNYAKINAETTQKLRRNYAEVAQKLRRDYAKITSIMHHEIHNANNTKKISKRYTNYAS
jgi:hypothetical protein